MTNQTKKAAISLAYEGFPIFPCTPDKKPLTRRGFHDATTNLEEIEQWWDRHPDALIGMPTGDISGIVVLDVDIKNEVDGTKALQKLEKKHGTLPETPISQTQSGGLHYHFMHPGIPIKNSASKLGDGLDIRGDGGYIIVPPSKGYMYVNEIQELAEMPDWLLEATKKETKKDKPSSLPKTNQVTVGNRNSHLASLAGSLRHRGVEQNVILATLLAENDTFPQPLDQSEVEQIASSISRYEPDTDVSQALDNEDGIALMFTERTKDTLRYVNMWGQWFRWEQGIWKTDNTLAVYDCIRTMCRDTFSSDERARKRLMNAKTIASIEKLMRADRIHASHTDQWDKNDWVLNTPEGIVDLTSGEFKGHDPEEYCTKSTSIGIEDEAPHWKQFLEDITAGDKALISFLQRVAGYAATGSIREQALFFCYGTGGNGKGTFLNTIHHILNDYSTIATTDMFTESKHARHPTELAALRGARLVIAQETDEGKRWDEVKIKTLTGGDPITARFMRQDFFTFIPKFTLVIAGNHKPALKTVDESIRRRFHMIPFTVTIPREKRDPDLAEKLTSEWGGILKWIVEGAMEYQKIGLAPPSSVLEATNEYFEDEDVFQQWIKDKCDVGTDLWCSPSALFNSWKAYAQEANFPAGTQKPFKQKLENAGFHQGKSSAKGGRFHEGIRVKIEEVPAHGQTPSQARASLRKL